MLRVSWLVGLAAVLWGAGARAADNPGKARAQYVECKALFDAGKVCPALAACEAGVEALDLAPLRRLTDQARTACVARQRAAAARRAERACGEGRRSVGGACCFAGQGVVDGRCAGVPSACPAGLSVDVAGQTCAPPACGAGKVHVDGVHCCWPDQVWYAERSRCLGIPVCPAGLRAEGEACVVVVPDMDEDGLPDADDGCPTVAEDRDGFEDGDGCPEVDNDGDGICDAFYAASVGSAGEGERVAGFSCTGSDGCPNAAEDVDGFEDGDGCPDGDNDGDGVADGDDLCPDVAGPVAWSGCVPPPDHTLAIVGWSGVGLGAALAVAGGAVMLSTLDDREALAEPEVSVGERDVVLSLTEVEADERRARIEEREQIGVGALIGGGALMAAGAVVLLVDAFGGEEPAVQVEVGPGPGGGASVGVWGRF
ncbi:MAG: hypothetical protein H6703_12365 [Myxococcales bacterium]|nr:hypothetical protein [Myxococcales bacterium]